MSRRQDKYERRQAARLAKREKRCEEVGGVEDVFSFNTLYRAGKECCSGVRWKNSVQQYEAHIFSHTATARREIIDGTWEPDEYSHFTICERGKTRNIDAPRIQDRQVQKVYTQRVLFPLYEPSMIYNNGASIKGKGLEFSKRKLKEDLRRHYRRYGRDGWVILTDFKQFFPSVSHEELLKRHKALILDDGLRAIGDAIVESAGGDRGLPLGVEPSQAEMVAFPSALDNYIKCQLGMKGAGHYMDDYYILVPPGKDPKEIMNLVVAKAESIKLTISPNKSRIVPLTKPFRFCKAKYTLTETGRVVMNGNPDSFRRARRKLKAYYRKVQSHEMTYEDLWASVNSSMAYLNGYDDHAKLVKYRQFFYALFGFSCEEYENFRTRGMKTVKYIAHRRFKDVALCGNVNIPAGTEVELDHGILVWKDRPICKVTSESAHQYFACNEDGCGMLRGKLTQAIQNTLAKGDSNDAKHQERWDKVWNDPACKKFRRKEYKDYWLWNHDFFEANIMELRHIAWVVGAKEVE